MFVDITNVFIL